jgi:hypothetical protein
LRREEKAKKKKKKKENKRKEKRKKNVRRVQGPDAHHQCGQVKVTTSWYPENSSPPNVM